MNAKVDSKETIGAPKTNQERAQIASDEEAQKIDLELQDIEQFTGSEELYSLGLPYRFKITEGVKYIMDNGYSWLVTDAAAIIKYKLRNEPFITIKLSLNEHGADVIYDDGNGNILYRQAYRWTDAKKNIKLFYDSGIFMLPTEY